LCLRCVAAVFQWSGGSGSSATASTVDTALATARSHSDPTKYEDAIKPYALAVAPAPLATLRACSVPESEWGLWVTLKNQNYYLKVSGTETSIVTALCVAAYFRSIDIIQVYIPSAHRL
jgi:hypothetical protein